MLMYNFSLFLCFVVCNTRDRLFYMNTFPGFIIPFGSNKFFMSFMTCTPVAPISSGNRACLPHPTPCSPVHVPPMARARLGDRRKRNFGTVKNISYPVNSHLAS